MMTKHILIVEDSMGIARPLERALSLNQTEHFLVKVSGSAEEALAALEQQPFDLVITDLIMPGMDGLELLERIHNSAAPPLPGTL